MCLLATAGALVTYGLVSNRNTQVFISDNVQKLLQEEAKNNLGSLAEAQAAMVQSALQDNLDTARTLATVFAVLQEHEAHKAKQEGITNSVRELLNAILHRTLENNPKYLGAYTAWEPGALDGRDAEFAGKAAEGYDASGRFIPYWNRDENGKIARQPLVDYESQATYANGIRRGGWYLRPRETGKESVLDPFPYVVQGKRDWLTTLSVPIKRDNTFLGVAGTDVRLNFLQEMSQEVDKRLYDGQGNTLIISYEGIIVASSDNPDQIGKPLREVITTGWETVLQQVQSGTAKVSVSENSGNWRAFAPIRLGRTDKPWSILIRVKPEVVLHRAALLENALSERARQNSTWQIGMITAPPALLAKKAHRLARLLKKAVGHALVVSTRPGASRVGGGAFPEHDLPTTLVALTALPGFPSPDSLRTLLLSTDPPLVGRIEEDALLLDPRTLAEDELRLTAAVLRQAVETAASPMSIRPIRA